VSGRATAGGAEAGGGGPALTIDARGKRCPIPVIELARHFGEVALGETVEVYADDPAASADVPAWCRLREQEFLGERALADGATAYAVRRLS
jgi:TusA-related sulfurtransferase